LCIAKSQISGKETCRQKLAVPLVNQNVIKEIVLAIEFFIFIAVNFKIPSPLMYPAS